MGRARPVHEYGHEGMGREGMSIPANDRLVRFGELVYGPDEQERIGFRPIGTSRVLYIPLEDEAYEVDLGLVGRRVALSTRAGTGAAVSLALFEVGAE